MERGKRKEERGKRKEGRGKREEGRGKREVETYGFLAFDFSAFLICANVLYLSAHFLHEPHNIIHTPAENNTRQTVKSSPVPPLPNDFIIGS